MAKLRSLHPDDAPPFRSRRRRDWPGDDLEVGDRVEIIPSLYRRQAIVIEDRGDLGINGRRLLRIRPIDGLDELGITDDRSFEMPAADLRKVEPEPPVPARASAAPKRRARAAK